MAVNLLKRFLILLVLLVIGATIAIFSLRFNQVNNQNLDSYGYAPSPLIPYVGDPAIHISTQQSKPVIMCNLIAPTVASGWPLRSKSESHDCGPPDKTIYLQEFVLDTLFYAAITAAIGFTLFHIFIASAKYKAYKN